MTIRQVKKQLVFPPSHLYIEDIEEILDLMITADQTRQKRRELAVEKPAIEFVVGDKKECDSIDDLKKLGGKWRNFKMGVGSGTFRASRYALDLSVSDEGQTSSTVLRLTTTREVKLRSFLLQIPLWIAWPFVSLCPLLVFITPASKSWQIMVLCIFVISVVAAVWALSANTIVELRYSHDPSPKMETAKEWASKAIWIVLGVILAGIAQWFWKYLTKQ